MPPPEPGLSPWDESHKWTALGTRDNRYVIHQRGDSFWLYWSVWDEYLRDYAERKYLGCHNSLADAQQAAVDHDKEEW